MGKDEKKPFFWIVRDEKLQTDILVWWKGMLQNNGSKARLKRCASPSEAALHPETHSLMRILPQWFSFEAAATITGILAHVKINGDGFIAAKLGTPVNNRVPFSETRFRQFLSCREWNEFYTALRRAVTILDGNVNPLSIVDVILHWDEENRGKTYKEPGKSLKFVLSKEYYSQILK